MTTAAMVDVQVECVARVCHEANRSYALATGEDPSKVYPTWDDAPEEIRESARIGVRAALAGATPEQLHESWCETKRTNGWTYGEVRDNDAKVHPCLCAYGELPTGQRKKDALFSGIVAAIR